MSCNNFIEEKNEGYVIRVRLQPSSSSCKIKGISQEPDGDFLKISVCSVPEKGKANKELVEFLAKTLKIAKSNFEIISGATEKHKKILLKTKNENIKTVLEKLAGENDGSTNN